MRNSSGRIECLLAHGMDTGKTGQRDFTNATVGFQELGELTAKSPNSLMRVFGQNGKARVCAAQAMPTWLL